MLNQRRQEQATVMEQQQRQLQQSKLQMQEKQNQVSTEKILKVLSKVAIYAGNEICCLKVIIHSMAGTLKTIADMIVFRLIL
jgi:hypothetical protein